MTYNNPPCFPPYQGGLVGDIQSTEVAIPVVIENTLWIKMAVFAIATVLILKALR